ncbi:MAG: ParA family protein [Prevotellaceae bacterium]|jgi:cellulose biosynthesis protein BcsQ|nr:ParA family protein [Prevotellaceae bacterium]
MTDPHKHKPFYIAFATQKGGAGKSSFTILAASIAHYTSKRNVAVIDCDYPQLSIANMRKRELENISKNATLKNLALAKFSEHNKTSYVVESAATPDAIKVAEKIASAQNVDYIFFDLPGTVNQPGILTLIQQMDYIFTPISADRRVVESSLSFLLMLRQLSDEIKSYVFWNMVDGREKTNLYEAYNQLMKEYRIPILETMVPYLLRFHKEAIDYSQEGVFCSTLLAPSRSMLSNSRVHYLCDEIFEIINQ